MLLSPIELRGGGLQARARAGAHGLWHHRKKALLSLGLAMSPDARGMLSGIARDAGRVIRHRYL